MGSRSGESGNKALDVGGNLRTSRVSWLPFWEGKRCSRLMESFATAMVTRTSRET